MGASSDKLTGTLKAQGEQARQAVTETVKEATAKPAPSGTHRAGDTDLSQGLGFPS